MTVFRSQILELIDTYGRNNVMFTFESPILGKDLEKSSLYHVPVRQTNFMISQSTKLYTTSEEDLITSIDLLRPDGYIVNASLSYLLIAWARGDVRIFIIASGSDGEDEYNEVFAKTYNEMCESLKIRNAFSV